MPISSKQYESVISTFISDWGAVLSKKIAGDLSNLWKWTRDYDIEMKKRQVSERLIYIKRGVNLVSKLYDDYSIEDSELKDMLVKCKFSIFKGDGVCSEQTRNELSRLIKEYNIFISELVGCYEYGVEFLLQLLKRQPKRYHKEISKLEDICLNLRLERTYL